MELGQTRNLTEAFFARRAIVNKSSAKDVERVMNKFKMATLSYNSAPAQSTSYTFWKKNEAKEVINLMDDDSLNPDDVVNCPLCRDEFKKFSKKKKEKCLVCGRIVCSNCNSNTLPIKTLDGAERYMKMCTSCHHTITKENKRVQLKQFFIHSLKSSFSTFYEEVYFLVSVVQRDLPKFKALLAVPLTPSSLKKAKELDETLGRSFQDLDREIKNLPHFQVTTKKQQQVKDAIKMYFITTLAGPGPEYKLLHKQFETAATQPLAPDEPVRSSSHPSIPSSTTPPSSSPPSGFLSPLTSNKRGEKRQTMFGAKLSSFTSLFSTDHAKPANPETTPYISGVNPLLSPLSGGVSITILGERFDPDCYVEIGGIACSVLERKSGKLVVESPPQSVAEAQDVVVVNNGGERCVMQQILFYADDSMFTTETPSVVEDNIYDYSAPSNTKKQDISPSKNNNGLRTSSSTSLSSSSSSTSQPKNHIRNPSRSESTDDGPLSSSSSSSSSFSSSFSASSSATSQSKNHIRNPSKSENTDEGELSVNMINPVVSPLQGTKIVMELSRVLPHGTTVKIGGKQVNIFPSDDNPNEVSFISPPLPSGSKVIQITLPSGKVTNLDGLLIYEELMPKTNSYSNSHSASYHQQPAAPIGAAIQSSGRVWGKRA